MADEKSPTAMVIGETVVRAAVAILVPFGGAAVVVYDAIRGHMATQGQLTIEEITEQVGAERLAERIIDSPEFAALAVNALDTALRTGFEAKRKLLSQVVANAALDDAKVDEGSLLTAALRDLDAPHIRCLQRLRIAVDAIPTDTPTHELNRVLNEAAHAATANEPEPVRAALLRTAVGIGPSGLTFSARGAELGNITNFGRRLLDELNE